MPAPRALLLLGLFLIPFGAHADGDPHRAAEARLLAVAGQIKNGDNAGADAEIGAAFASDPELAAVDRIVAFQLLALRLGATLLDAGQSHAALALLDPLADWPREKLRAAQQARLDALPPGPAFDSLRAAIRDDLARLDAVPDYDNAVRLRAERARADDPEGVPQLQARLATPNLPPETAARTLDALGDAYLKRGQPGKAVPCYQRVYIMYGHWPDAVAKAYWQSGQAFEKLAMRREAMNTYREFLARADLAASDEFARARKRLAELEAAPQAP